MSKTSIGQEPNCLSCWFIQSGGVMREIPLKVPHHLAPVLGGKCSPPSSSTLCLHQILGGSYSSGNHCNYCPPLPAPWQTYCSCLMLLPACSFVTEGQVGRCDAKAEICSLACPLWFPMLPGSVRGKWCWCVRLYRTSLGGGGAILRYTGKSRAQHS